MSSLAPVHKKRKTSTGHKIAILDAGSQFAKVIDRRIRDLCVCSELIPFNTPADELKDFNAFIISGGPQSVYGDAAPKYDPKIFEMGIPILGICYGMQLMNHIYGGKIEPQDVREDGQFPLDVVTDSALFKDIPRKFSALLTHGDSVVSISDKFELTAKSEQGIPAAIEDKERKFYGVQFHPEVDLTEHGMDIFRNFLFTICNLEADFTITSRKDEAIRKIQQQVGDKKVLVLVSGGVDSSVCAALLKAALPVDQIFAIHIDNGFMRKNESSGVEEALKTIGLNLKVINASDDFYNGTTDISGVTTDKLKNTLKPEHKRKIIGDTFMRVSEKAVQEFGLKFEDVLLAQGTLRPDLIESASKVASKGQTADVIKTHHNDTELVRALRDAGRVIEPLSDYHKDEVRVLGKELGLPDDLVYRQPFPGPGLAVRIICGDEPYVTDNDMKIVDELKQFESDDLSCALLPTRTVGVQGDGRSYNRLVSLSSKSSKPSNWKDLMDLAKTIPRTVHSVNRVVYAFGEPISGHVTSITQTRLTPDVIALLQEADNRVNQILLKYKLTIALSQVPVILFPPDFGVDGNRSVCIRTFITNDFMTGVPAVPGDTIPEEAVLEMVKEVGAVDGISRVCYDLTPKPPGTTEWE